MNRQEISKYSMRFAYILMGIGIFLIPTLYIIDPYVFCVEGSGIVDPEDKKNCFKTLGEANNYTLYLIEKYDLNSSYEEKEWVNNYNGSFNIS